jgi:hypothetical protein
VTDCVAALLVSSQASERQLKRLTIGCGAEPSPPQVEDAVSFAFPFVKVVVKTTKQLTLAETPINTDGSACWKLESRTGSVIGKWPRELQQVRWRNTKSARKPRQRSTGK